jgi:hypothetical protein
MEGQFNESSLLMIHPSGKSMRFKVSPAPIDGFSIQVLNAFNTNAELRLEHTWYIHALPLLPMPVLRSPIICLLSYDAANPWVSRFGDSIAMVSMLRTVYHCYNSKELAYFEKNRARILDARSKYDKRIEELRETLQTQLDTIYESFKGNQRVALTQFAERLEWFTVEIIRTLEMALLEMFGLIVEERWLTPHQYFGVEVLDPKQIAGIPMVYKHIFETKHNILNKRLEKEGFPLETFFHPEEIDERMKTTPQDEMYKGFIDRITLWEYFRYLDCDKILKI